MCPGLTSPGAKLYPADADTVVVSFFNRNVQYLFLHYKTLQCNLSCSLNIANHIPFTFLITYCTVEFALNKWMQAIMAEGKQHALCVGVMKMSAESM